MERRIPQEKILGPHNASDFRRHLLWMVGMRGLRSFPIFLTLLLLISSPSLQAKSPLALHLNYFSSFEAPKLQMNEGIALFNSIYKELSKGFPQLVSLDNALEFVDIELSKLPLLDEEALPLYKTIGLITSGEFPSSDDLDVPGSLVLGGFEILVGGLVHCIPGCGWLGKALILDGVRRGINGLEELDKSNKQINKQTSFSQRLSDEIELKDLK